MPKTPTPNTNKDLLAAIYEQGVNQLESITLLQSDMNTVKEQVKYTNGKVAGLMEDKIRREERERTLSEIKTVPVVKNADTVIVNKRWYETEAGQKIFLGLASILTSVGVAISLTVGFLTGGHK